MKKELPQFHVEICHPESKYRIEPVYDKIKTLERGGLRSLMEVSSGEWGDSHKSWTEQYGTPTIMAFLSTKDVQELAQKKIMKRAKLVFMTLQTINLL